ncbi:hypothetical protein [Shinella sp. NM-101]|uniref:hypothetical protein n=1 Tax=Shinella sp. NM-101 TaxID=2744455 RepID=UPI001F32AE0A|nr:hypothetical protein [Shinella sp. NM-101]
MIPKAFTDQVADLYHRIAELERRARNRRRSGLVADGPDSQGRYRIALSSQDGKPFLTGWIKARTLGAGGAKIDVVFAKGEQVDVTSESGDLTDAVIDMATYSTASARENAENVPLHIKIGETVIAASGSGVTITASSGHLN